MILTSDIERIDFAAPVATPLSNAVQPFLAMSKALSLDWADEGIVVRKNGSPRRFFYPWHQIKLLVFSCAEPEEELAEPIKAVEAPVTPRRGRPKKVVVEEEGCVTH